MNLTGTIELFLFICSPHKKSWVSYAFWYRRMKREKREEIVRKGVVEHERLEQQFEKKEKELRRQYEELQKRFEEERMKVKEHWLECVDAFK